MSIAVLGGDYYHSQVLWTQKPELFPLEKGADNLEELIWALYWANNSIL